MPRHCSWSSLPVDERNRTRQFVCQVAPLASSVSSCSSCCFVGSEGQVKIGGFEYASKRSSLQRVLSSVEPFPSSPENPTLQWRAEDVAAGLIRPLCLFPPPFAFSLLIVDCVERPEFIPWEAYEVLFLSLPHDTASDVWSLATTMWEVFSTGQRPFDGLEPKTIFKDVCSAIFLFFVDSNRYNMELCWTNLLPALHTSMSSCSSAGRARVHQGEVFIQFAASWSR